MSLRKFGCAVVLAGFAAPAAFASTDPVPARAAAAPALPESGQELFDPVRESSSQPALPDSPGIAAVPRSSRGGMTRSESSRSVSRPFSSLAIQIKGGFAGIGADFATPLAGRLNLRAGGTFMSVVPSLDQDGINIVGDLELRSGSVSLDIFPIGTSFRISPGVVFYNGTHISATADVPGGQAFSLGESVYISSPTDPVHGTFDMAFGNKFAPSLTIGSGNMIPRNGSHWSVPFEIGAMYIGKAPSLVFNLSGSACQGSTDPQNCGPVGGDATSKQNIVQEQADVNNNIPPQLKFFPILSLGLSYKFGHSGRE